MEGQGIERNSKLLKFAILEALITYTIWPLFDDPIASKIFYIGIALFIFLLALYIKLVSKPSFSIFFLFCLALNNLLDEILFDPQKIGINEYIATAIIIIIYFLKDKPLKD